MAVLAGGCLGDTPNQLYPPGDNEMGPAILDVMLCVRREPSPSWMISAARSRQRSP